jgi:UDP-glucose 4-epimerase
VRALVTGATGAVGPALIRLLLAEGWAVRALVRKPAAARLPPDVDIVEGDITDTCAVTRAVAGCDVVFHLAALLHVVDVPPTLAPEYERVNVSGTRILVDAAQETGVGRLVFFSSISVYGPSPGHGAAEDYPCRPDTDYGRTKLAAEQIALSARAPGGNPLGVVLRLAAVYGPGIKGNYERLARAIARGRFVRVGPGHNRRALVFDEDVARAAVLAALSPVAAGRIYNVADGVPHSMRDIVAAISAALERRPTVWRLPAAPVRRLAGVIEAAATRLGLRPPIRRATIEKYLEDVMVDATRIQRELGFAPRVTLRDGWRRVVESLEPAANRPPESGPDEAGPSPERRS